MSKIPGLETLTKLVSKNPKAVLSIISSIPVIGGLGYYFFGGPEYTKVDNKEVKVTQVSEDGNTKLGQDQYGNQYRFQWNGKKWEVINMTASIDTLRNTLRDTREYANRFYGQRNELQDSLNFLRDSINMESKQDSSKTALTDSTQTVPTDSVPIQQKNNNNTKQNSTQNSNSQQEQQQESNSHKNISYNTINMDDVFDQLDIQDENVKKAIQDGKYVIDGSGQLWINVDKNSDKNAQTKYKYEGDPSNKYFGEYLITNDKNNLKDGNLKENHSDLGDDPIKGSAMYNFICDKLIQDKFITDKKQLNIDTVKKVQLSLNKLFEDNDIEARLTPDGILGPDTYRAIKAAQQANYTYNDLINMNIGS